MGIVASCIEYLDILGAAVCDVDVANTVNSDVRHSKELGERASGLVQSRAARERKINRPNRSRPSIEQPRAFRDW
jgi:hypothetical protein